MTQAAKVFVAIATLLVAVVTLGVVVGVFLITSTSRQQETLDELKAGQASMKILLDHAETERTLLIECLTLAPKAGKERDESDKVHECQLETEALRSLAVAKIAQTNIFLHECVKEQAPDLEACITAKTKE